jgi:DNA-binding NarL/FixJ family response regulator
MTRAATHTPTVILVDDHPLFVAALELSLQDAGVDVVGTAGSGAEALELVGRLEPDAVLLDLAMPGMDGLTCLARLAEAHPDVKIVVVSSEDDGQVIDRALAAGAVCFVGKCVSPEYLIHALRAVTCDGLIRYRGGEAVAASHRASRPDPERHGLTKRELEILRRVASGASNSQMARALWVTEQTIKFHLSNIYKKLGVPNRTAASAAANARGLLDSVEVEVAQIADRRGVLA